MGERDERANWRCVEDSRISALSEGQKGYMRADMRGVIAMIEISEPLQLISSFLGHGSYEGCH